MTLQYAGDVSDSQEEVEMVAAVEAVRAAARTALKVARTASPEHACARATDDGSWKTTLELRRDVVPPDGDGDGDNVRDVVDDREAALLGVVDEETDDDAVTDAATDGESVTERPDVTVTESDTDINAVVETDTSDADAEEDRDGDTDTEGCTDDVASTEGAADGDTAKPPANVSTEPVVPETEIRRTTLLKVSATSSVLLPLMATPNGEENKALVPTPFA